MNTSLHCDLTSSSPAKTNDIHLNLITALNGSVQKKIVADASGKPIKDAKHSLGISEGIGEDITVKGFSGFARLLSDLRPNQALILGQHGLGQQRIIPRNRYSGQKDTITRTKDFYSWPDGYFPLLLDHDPEPGQPELTADQFWAELVQVFPEFSGAGRVVTVSTSSAIYSKATGECLKPASGHHTYIVVRGDIERFKTLFQQRCWLHNSAFFKLAKQNAQTGVAAILERFLADTAVFSPERLIYEAGALFEADSPFEQRLPEPAVFEGGYLDLDALPNLTSEQQQQAESNRAAARAKLEPEQLDKVVEHVQKQKPNLRRQKAKQIARKQIHSARYGYLDADHRLYLMDGRVIRAGDIDASLNNAKLRDPQEPDYRGGAQVAIIKADENGWTIASMAHGGCKYRLSRKSHKPVKDRSLDAIDLCRRDIARKLEWLHNCFARQHSGKRILVQTKSTRKPQPASQPYEYAKDGAIVAYDPKFAQRCWVIEVTASTVPTVEDWEAMGQPRLLCRHTDYASVLYRMVELGYKTILSDSIVGSGKSHVAGELLKQHQLDQAEQSEPTLSYYLSNDYRNPTTGTLEQIPETVSGGALMLETDKQTPGGRPYRRRPTNKTQRQTPDISATCIEDENIQRLRSLGVDIHRGKKSNFCQTACRMRGSCDYLRQKKQQETESALRSHPSYELTQGKFVIVDEAGQAITTARRKTVPLANLDTERGRIARMDGFAASVGQPVLDAITQGLQRAIDERDPRFGLTDADVRQFLPSAEQLEQLLWENTSDAWLYSKDPWREITSPSALAKRIKRACQPDIEEVFQVNSTPEDKAKRIEETFATSGYADLLYAIAGDPTNITITPQGEITITRSDRRIVRNLDKFDTVILLDATPDVGDLARKLKRPAKNFARVSAYKPRFENQTITLVDGFGQARKQRGHAKHESGEHSLERRAPRIVEALCNRHQGQTIGVIDYKAHLDSYEALKAQHSLVVGAEYVDSRGSNRFKQCDVLLQVAKPAENLGAMLTQWHIDTGESFTKETASLQFWAWYNRRSTHETIQGLGRLRAQHRETPVQVYVISGASDREAQAIAAYFPGATVKTESIFTICPEAAPKGEQTRYQLFHALERQFATGNSQPTIDQVAAEAGVSKSTVSKFAKAHYGDYQRLLEGFLFLYKSYIETGNLDLDQIPEDQVHLAQRYLPELVATYQRGEIDEAEMLEELKVVADAYSKPQIAQTLAIAPAETTAILWETLIFALGLANLLNQPTCSRCQRRDRIGLDPNASSLRSRKIRPLSDIKSG
jgi:hypothetical protein